MKNINGFFSGILRNSIMIISNRARISNDFKGKLTILYKPQIYKLREFSAMEITDIESSISHLLKEIMFSKVKKVITN